MACTSQDRRLSSQKPLLTDPAILYICLPENVDEDAAVDTICGWAGFANGGSIRSKIIVDGKDASSLDRTAWDRIVQGGLNPAEQRCKYVF